MCGVTLVTGANGYTGGHRCRYLAERGVPARGMDHPPDGRPSFAHPDLELLRGELRDRPRRVAATSRVVTLFVRWGG